MREFPPWLGLFGGMLIDVRSFIRVDNDGTVSGYNAEDL